MICICFDPSMWSQEGRTSLALGIVVPYSLRLLNYKWIPMALTPKSFTALYSSIGVPPYGRHVLRIK